MAQTITDVRPFTRVKDVDVEMTVVKPQAIIGLGNMLILHEVASSGLTPSGVGSVASPAGKHDTGSTAGAKHHTSTAGYWSC